MSDPVATGAASPEEREILAVLEAMPRIDFALLFGSRTREGARPDSDFDVAIHVARGATASERAELRERIVASLEPAIAVDVVILNDAPPLLAQRALEGRALLVRDRTAHVRFAVRTLALAGDEAYWREFHARARERRLAEGRFGRP